MEKMELEFDKALLALHPLAITISAALYNQLVAATIPPRNRWLVLVAWGSWILGIICTLLSFRTSVISNRRNLDRFDEGKLHASNYRDAWADCATPISYLRQYVLIRCRRDTRRCFLSLQKIP
jgi:hypothetical protein